MRQAFGRAIMHMAELPDIAGVGPCHIVALAIIFLRHPHVIKIELRVISLRKPENILMARRKAALAAHALRVMPGDPALRRKVKLFFQHQIKPGNELDPHKTIERSAGLEDAHSLRQPVLGEFPVIVTVLEVDIVAIVLAKVIGRVRHDEINAFCGYFRHFCCRIAADQGGFREILFHQGYCGERFAIMRCKVRRCMLSRLAVSETLWSHSS